MLFRKKVVDENFLAKIMNLLRSFLYDKYKTVEPLKQISHKKYYEK